ncbi:MAG: M13-type metalloendopeptidase [Candidatus Ornithomonoglobus sp.]
MKKLLLKKITAALTAAAAAAGISPAALAEKPQETEYATREYVVSEFVQSVGRSNLTGSGYVLSTFSDADEVSEEYINDLEKAAANGIIQGYDDKTIHPKENITRIEALTILARCVPEGDDLTNDPIEFTDVPEWAKHDIDNLSKAGLVEGYGNGLLGAYDNITVEQVKLLTDRSDALLNTVTPGESFYGYVNNKAFRNYEQGSSVTVDALHGVVIPNENSWSYMSDMYNTMVDNEHEILTKLVNGELEYEKGSTEQRIYDMLECIDKKDEINDADRELYNKYRQMIIDAEDIEGLLKAVNDIYVETGINNMFDVSIGLEPEKHDVYPQIQPLSAGYGGIIAFSKESAKKYDDKYHALLKACISYSGLKFSDADIKKACEIQETAAKGNSYIDLYAIGKIIRMTFDDSYTQEDMDADMAKLEQEHKELIDEDTGEMKDISEMINIYTLEEADKQFDGLKVSEMLTAAGYHDLEGIIMSSTGCIEACKDIFKAENLNAFKINALLNLAQTLQMAESDTEKKAYDRLDVLMFAVMTGWDYDTAEKYFIEAQEQPVDSPEDEEKTDDTEGTDETTTRADELLTDQNLQLIGSLLPNDIGLLYCKYYYSDETSEVVGNMMDDIWDAYIARFEKNEWMSEETKANAIKKIENMIAVIGYPDNYNFPEIISVEDGGTFFKNSLNIAKDELATNIRFCGEDEFIRTMMLMAPDTVNACYIPIFNIMNIPAGMLGWPVYDENASYEANLGSIGAVIAHEIGHAFDAEGAKYDENGCLNNWWTEEDAEAFETKKQEFVDYYSNFEVMDGVVQDSALTITENMADVAGIQCVFDVIGDNKEGQKEALEAFAKMWARIGSASIITDDYYLQDVHSSNQVRVNACVTTLDCFYDLYDVKEGDPMYVAPEDRLRLW